MVRGQPPTPASNPDRSVAAAGPSPDTGFGYGETPALTGSDEYQLFCDFLRARTGLSFTEAKRYFVDRRLAERMRAVGVADIHQYLDLIRTEGERGELQQLVNAMTINETYFFRERYQLECLINSALEEIVRNRPADRPVRIWSAGCSTGEEPYSIAITLLENWKRVDDFDIEIHACDIDSSVLQRAIDGIYEERSLHLLPHDLRARYFLEHGPGRWRIIAGLRESIDFTLTNIADPRQSREYRDFDIIFCRNLLIYFDELGQREAATLFYEALRPGGFICLGHSESMSRMSSLFIPRRFPDAILHQKPLVSHLSAGSTPGAWPPVVPISVKEDRR